MRSMFVSVFLAMAVAAACAGESVSSGPTVPAGSVASAATTVAPLSTALITSPPATTTASTVPVVNTDPPATSLVVASSVAPADSSPLTTEPVAVAELVLSDKGIGSATFGASPDGVIEYVTSVLGGNTGDTGWVDRFSFAACDGTRARRVDWGVLSLLFGDVSSHSAGRDHFMGWEYGSVSEFGDEPVGLRTDGGLTLGSTAVNLVAEFPDVGVYDGDAERDEPAYFSLNENFYGLLSGVKADDFVTAMFGGYGCGS